MLEYGNVGMMENIASGGPRSVVAGRDRARPSKGYLLIIPIFHHSIIPFQVIPPFVPAWLAGRLSVTSKEFREANTLVPYCLIA
jgi:hypothetical protein